MTTINPPLRLLTTFAALYPEHDPTPLFAVDGRDLWVAAAPHGPVETFVLHCVELEAATEFTLRSAKQKRTAQQRPLPRWARYAAGVALATFGAPTAPVMAQGYALVLAGDEPQGPRYEHALGVAIAQLYAVVHNQDYTADALVSLTERIRREYVEG
jgi:galactokinase